MISDPKHYLPVVFTLVFFTCQSRAIFGLYRESRVPAMIGTPFPTACGTQNSGNQATDKQITNKQFMDSRYRYRRRRVAEPEPGFLAGAGPRLFWLELEPGFSGWSRTQAFLAGAGARLIWLAGARLFWLEPDPGFFG